MKEGKKTTLRGGRGSPTDYEAAKHPKEVTCNRCKKVVQVEPLRSKQGKPIMKAHLNAREKDPMTCGGAFTTDWTPLADKIPGLVCPHGVHVTNPKGCDKCPPGWAKGKDPEKVDWKGARAEPPSTKGGKCRIVLPPKEVTQEQVNNDPKLMKVRLAHINEAKKLLGKALDSFDIGNFYFRDPVEVFTEIAKDAEAAGEELRRYAKTFSTPEPKAGPAGSWPSFKVEVVVSSPLPSDDLSHELLDALKTANQDGYVVEGEVSLKPVEA